MPAIRPPDGPKICRIMHDPALPGPWNMAVDEILLRSAAEDGVTTLRTYAWSTPTLTLGYFQHYDDRSRHTNSAGCPCIRRQTGGGAILHDQEITYSLCVPVPRRTIDTRYYYHLVHDSLRTALASFGIEVELCAAAVAPASTEFLCFQRRSFGDVICGGYKILGSAQRRHGRGLLQHGSLLLTRSDHAPELPGLLDLVPPSDQRPTSEIVIQHVQDAISSRLDARPQPGHLTREEQIMGEQLMKSRFESELWNRRR